MPDTSTSPSTFEEIGPPAGSPDALAMWREVLTRLEALSSGERAELDLQLAAARGDVWARVISVDPIDGDLDLRDRDGRPLVDEADLVPLRDFSTVGALLSPKARI